MYGKACADSFNLPQRLRTLWTFLWHSRQCPPHSLPAPLSGTQPQDSWPALLQLLCTPGNATAGTVVPLSAGLSSRSPAGVCSSTSYVLRGMKDDKSVWQVRVGSCVCHAVACKSMLL